jgi:hypothetical protein
MCCWWSFGVSGLASLTQLLTGTVTTSRRHSPSGSECMSMRSSEGGSNRRRRRRRWDWEEQGRGGEKEGLLLMLLSCWCRVG